jgi:hypothetical protein
VPAILSSNFRRRSGFAFLLETVRLLGSGGPIDPKPRPLPLDTQLSASRSGRSSSLSTATTPTRLRRIAVSSAWLNGAVVVDRRVDYLHGLAFEAVDDLLKRPTLLVLDRALDELLGEAVDLLALLLVARIDSIQFEAERVGEYLFARLATRIA